MRRYFHLYMLVARISSLRRVRWLRISLRLLLGLSRISVVSPKTSDDVLKNWQKPLWDSHRFLGHSKVVSKGYCKISTRRVYIWEATINLKPLEQELQTKPVDFPQESRRFFSIWNSQIKTNLVLCPMVKMKLKVADEDGNGKDKSEWVSLHSCFILFCHVQWVLTSR